MFVIVEGVDGSGKSTLCTQLHDLGYNVVKDERYSKRTYKSFLEMAKSTKKYILDRGIITEWTYRLEDGYSLDKHALRFNQVIELLKYSKIVYCISNTAFEDSMKRGETNVTTKSKSLKLLRIYEFILATFELYSLCEIYYYDWRVNTMADIINFIEEAQNAV